MDTQSKVILTGAAILFLISAYLLYREITMRYTKSKVVLTSAALLFSVGAYLLYHEITLPIHERQARSGALVDRLATQAEEQRCFRDIKQKIRFKDEASLRIEGEPKTHYSGDMQIISLSLNGKNSYGGYTGPQDFDCFYTGADHKLYTVHNYDNY